MLNFGIRHHGKGEAIIETVIAMTILAIGITIAGQIMGSSLRNVNSTKNRVIAVNIAKEGVEAIRNIRDTNWLKYSGKKRECWNHQPASDTLDPCPDSTGEANPIMPGRYIAYKQPILDVNGVSLGWKWRLENLTEGKELRDEIPTSEDENPFYIPTPDGDISYIWDGKSKRYADLTQLYLVDIDPVTNSDDDLADDRYTNDMDTYNHALVLEDNALGKDWALKTIYRREIIISYLDNDGTEVTTLAGMSPSLNRMRIRSKVSWQESKNTFSTELTTHLTDYLGREDLAL